MKNVEFSILQLLDSPVPRFLFQQVVKDREVRFEELLKRTQRATDREQIRIEIRSVVAGAGTERNEETALREAIKGPLKELKDARLIKELGSPAEDFNIYYITADGLDVSRKLGI